MEIKITQTLNLLFYFTGLIIWALIPLALVIALGWYIFSALCTIIFVRRIAAQSNFKDKHGNPISFKAYLYQFKYWQPCTGQPYHVTMVKTGEKIWMPGPYGTKKYRNSIVAKEEAEWRALGGEYGSSS